MILYSYVQSSKISCIYSCHRPAKFYKDLHFHVSFNFEVKLSASTEEVVRNSSVSFFGWVHLGSKLISHLPSLQVCKYKACLNKLYMFHLKAKLILLPGLDVYNFHLYGTITQCGRAFLSCLAAGSWCCGKCTDALLQ